MEKTHISEEVQAQFERCANRAIAIFFDLKVNVKLACEIALNEITRRRSPDIMAAETGQEIWLLLEPEVTDRLRKEVGLGQKDPIVQTVVPENANLQPPKPGRKS